MTFIIGAGYRAPHPADGDGPVDTVEGEAVAAVAVHGESHLELAHGGAPGTGVQGRLRRRGG